MKKNKESARMRERDRQQGRDEERTTPGFQSSDHLWTVVKRFPEDYAPYGKRDRDGLDCSCGCRWYHELSGSTGMDWGVCANLDSYRAGLLTFEHQGCEFHEYDRRCNDPQALTGREKQKRYWTTIREAEEPKEESDLQR